MATPLTTAVPRTKPLDVLIAGGSLAGLLAGTVLVRHGHRARILERNPTPLLHDQGAGIVAGGDTLAFFAEHDRSRTAIAVSSAVRHYLDLEGKEVHREDWTQRMTSWDLLFWVLRAGFDGVGSESAGDGGGGAVRGYVAEIPEKQDGDGEASYEYGCTVTAIRDADDGARVEVTYSTASGASRTTTADMVIGADGPNSTVRGLFDPAAKRTYAGYIAWRGTADESELSEGAAEALSEKFTFYHGDGTQALAYLIPGPRGTVERGHRKLNWVLYQNYGEESQELADIMTDAEGRRHRITLPPGRMRPEMWEKYKAKFQSIVPWQFAEAMGKTEVPFVQAVTDVHARKATFLDGKVILVGDALAGFRPHTAASTTQAARNAMALGRWLEGKMTLEEWEDESMEFARAVQAQGVQMGNKSQFGGWTQLRKQDAMNK